MVYGSAREDEKEGQEPHAVHDPPGFGREDHEGEPEHCAGELPVLYREPQERAEQ